jgi:hypothetical protein
MSTHRLKTLSQDISEGEGAISSGRYLGGVGPNTFQADLAYADF